MNDPSQRDPIEAGLRAWLAGDLDALEAVLAPEVSLRAVDPGPWNCVGRDQVMGLLRRRQAENGDRPQRTVQVQRVDESTYTVHVDAPPYPDEPEPFPVATQVTVAGGLVTAMQQYRADHTDV